MGTATRKQIKLFNELKRQGRPSAYDKIDDLHWYQAWHIIAKMLKEEGDGSVYLDEDINKDILKQHSEAEKYGYNQKTILKERKYHDINVEQDGVFLTNHFQNEISEEIADTYNMDDSQMDWLKKGFKDDDYTRTETMSENEWKEEYDYNHGAPEDDDYPDPEGWKRDEQDGGYYREVFDLQKYKDDLLEKAVSFSRKKVEEDNIEYSIFENKGELDPTSLLGSEDKIKDGLKRQLPDLEKIKINESHSTNSIYMTLEMKDGETIDISFGDHAIVDGELQKLKPNEVLQDEKTFYQSSGESSQSMKIGYTENMGIDIPTMVQTIRNETKKTAENKTPARIKELNQKDKDKGIYLDEFQEWANTYAKKGSSLFTTDINQAFWITPTGRLLNGFIDENDNRQIDHAEVVGGSGEQGIFNAQEQGAVRVQREANRIMTFDGTLDNLSPETKKQAQKFLDEGWTLDDRHGHQNENARRSSDIEYEKWKQTQKEYKQNSKFAKHDKAKKVIEESFLEGGGTYNPKTMRRRDYRDGYMVAVAGAEVKVKQKDLTPELLNDYIKNKLKPGYEVGFWFNHEDGYMYIDNTKYVKSRSEAVALGKKNKQKAIWDNANGKEIKTND